MANPATARFSAILLLISFLVNITSAAETPSPSPSPSTSHSPHLAPASNPSPVNPPESPTPAPSPPNSPPAPSPEKTHSPSPAPAPEDVDGGRINHTDVPTGDGKSSSGGMSSGKKAGIAVGVIVGAGAVGLGALVYKKRRQNIQRSQYGYAARRELL